MPYHHGNLREALLERAAEVIAEHGVDAVSLRALARDLGVSHAAPRRHFSDRSALLAELAREGLERSIEAMDAGAARAGVDPVARYRALGRSYVQFAVEHPSYFRAINHPQVLAHAGEELAEAWRAWLARLYAGAEAARNAGWHPKLDVDVLVAFSCSAAMGAAQLFSDPRWRESFAGKDLDALVDSVLELTVHHSGAVAPAATTKKKKKKKTVSTRKAS